MPDPHRPAHAAGTIQAGIVDAARTIAPSPPPAPPPAEPDVRALFDEFAARAGAVAPAVDLPAVRARSDRRQAARWAIATAAAAALVVPVAIYVLTRPAVDSPLGTPVAPTPVSPAGAAVAPQRPTVPVSPNNTAAVVTSSAPALPIPPQAVASSVPPAAGPISGVDWANATFDVPANQTGCAAGRAQFRQGTADVSTTRYQLGGGEQMAFEAAYGDVDADGQAEALLVLSCMTPTRRNPPSLVLLLDANPALHTMALAFTSGPRVSDGEGRSRVSSPAIAADGTITFWIRTFEGNGQCEYRQHWNGTALVGACDP